MNIYQKLVEVQRVVSYLKKEAKGHQYNYTSSSQVLAAVRNKMDELGLLLIPAIVDKRVTMDTVENTDKYGAIKRTTTYFTELDLKFTWVNADNPEERIEEPWYGQGIDIAGEKGVGKALTYGEKYYILKFFHIATDNDDPDAFQHSHEPKQEQKTQFKSVAGPATKAQRDSINTAIKALGIDDKEVAQITKSLGIESSKTMTYVQASQLISTLAEYQPEGVAQ